MDNGTQPATRQDLHDLEQRLLDQVREAIHDSETRLLRAFHGYTEGNELRMKRLEGAEFTSAERLAKLEERMFDLEKRLPPANS